MSRIAGKPAGASPIRRLFYAATRHKVGKMVDGVGIAGHHPRLMVGMGLFEQSLDWSRKVDLELKALAGVKAAGLIGCPF